MPSMRSVNLAAPLVLLFLAALVLPARGEDELNTDKLSSKVADISFREGSGKPFDLYTLKDRQAVVIVFLNFECPVSTSYSDVLAQMAKSYAGRGVTFIGVSGRDEVKLEQLVQDVKECKLGFDVYLDEKRAAADALKARVTPEAFVLDHNFYLRYRGRIDNGYSARLKKNINITEHDLKDAIEAVLAGKEVPRPATRAIGCPLFLDKDTRKDGAVTYYRDVLPILQKNCQSCHRPGEVGPFSLLTYKQSVRWGEDIKEYTHSRKMPPWKPVEVLDCHNQRRLSDRDIATLAAWVDGKYAQGNLDDAPPPVKFPEGGWQRGKPDLILTIDDDFHLGPSGPDQFRCFVMPTHLEEDRYVNCVEVRPGNPRVVHHALTFIDTKGKGRELEQKERDRATKDDETDSGPGYSVGMGGVGFRPNGALRGWAPGILATTTPPGSGFLLPKGSDVILQVHYHRDGRPEKDRIQIGLYFAKGKVTNRFSSMVLPGRFLLIPAGNSHFKVQGSITVAKDCEIHDIMPHMHMLGKAVKVTITPPDGETKTVLRIDDWDYNWQEMYVFKEPLKVKEGTRLTVEAVYDNSARNPSNPNKPPRLVKFGEQTTDEMCFVFMGVTSAKEGPYVQRKRPSADKKQ